MITIPEWYDGQTILLTGGTGFMGKVLVEKLLRSCPGIRRIYMLARAKRGSAPSARVDEMAKLPLFQTLMKSNPEAMKKLVAVESDLLQPGLGLNKERKQQILSEVTIVFNMAASLRLEAGMKHAVANNTTGTKQVLDLALEMEQLKAFVHLSTAFCHCEYDKLQEEVYPPPHNPHDIMRLMEWMDDKTIELITPSLLGPHPNCYTYSKRLAEALVYEYKDKLPVCIARPSIVTPAYYEPVPGWVDTLNGPVGILVGAGKGVIRSMMCSPNHSAELIPVDIAINGLITIAWTIANNKPEEFPVYNLSSGDLVRISWKEILDMGRGMVYEHPFEYTLWYPDGNIRTSWLVHYICVLLFHYLPAYFIDFILLLARQKRFMVRLQNKISVGLEVLQYFTMRPWYFANQKFINLGKGLTEEDKETFFTTNVEYDFEKYFLQCILGARVYCMKEPLTSIPRTRRNLKILYVLHCLSRILFYGFLAWLVLHYVDSSRVILDYSANVLQRIPVISGLVPMDATTGIK